MRDGKDALAVNWFEIEIADAAGKITYRNSFITDLDITHQNVGDLSGCGRARWKIENETFNVLKTKGYNLDHGFGHGKKNLSAVLVALNLLAFAAHTLCEIMDDLWRLTRQKPGSRSQFFNTAAAATDLPDLPAVGQVHANHRLRQSAPYASLTQARHATRPSRNLPSRKIDFMPN